ncbi:hypothetical protein JCM8547_001775 [Rhodosporidiobolus lusitaniae]
MVVSLASTGGASKIYCVNGGGMTSKNAAAWLEAKLTDKNKRRKKGGQGGTGGDGEIRLIQDFDFPEASNKVKTTRDGKYLMATGTYKPRMKTYDLEELSLKTERVTDAENVDFCILSSDWMKTLHLQADRSMELHTQSSMHYRVRFPRHGRAIQYHFPTCDALVGGQGNEVWRFNLEAGRFMKPFGLEGALDADGGEQGGVGGGLDVVTGVNAIDINPAHQLLCFGTETKGGKGTVEMWDPRSRTRAGILRLPYATLAASSQSSASMLQARLPGVDDDAARGGVAVSSLASRADGLNLAVGTSTGHVLLYDLRANRPYTTKDQGYGLPVKKVEWVESSPATHGDAEREGGWVASTDEKVVKIWGKDTGNNLVAINPPNPINDLHIYPGTGLVFLANEASPMTGYYVPQLGPAPKWCRFLDNMTEEMGEDQEQLLYDDYKFIDRKELDELNLTHLMGTDTLKPYMHGFFVDLRLYTKARAIANPFAYQEHRDKLIRDKLAAEQESRIRGAKKAAGAAVAGVRVNKHLAKKMREMEERARKREAGEGEEGEGGDAEMEDGERRKRKRKTKEQGDQPSLLQDSRFGDLFTNPDFEIDEESREFQLLNPSTKPRSREDEESEEDEDEDEQDEPRFQSEEEDEESGDSDSSVEGELGFDSKRRPIDPPKRPLPKPSSSRPSASTSSFTAPSRSRPTLVAADASDDEELTSTRSRPLASVASSAASRAAQTIGQRAREAADSVSAKRRRRAEQAEEDAGGDADDIIRGAPGGGMEMSFIPKAKSKAEVDAKKKEVRDKKKAEKSEKGKYAMGLEMRSGGDQVEDEKEIEGEEGSGRTRMRKPARSASRNKTRLL